MRLRNIPKGQCKIINRNNRDNTNFEPTLNSLGYKVELNVIKIYFDNKYKLAFTRIFISQSPFILRTWGLCIIEHFVPRKVGNISKLASHS